MQPKNRRLVTEHTLEPLESRVEGLESMADISPGSVVDGQTANVIQRRDTQTHNAINYVIDTKVNPVKNTADIANRVAQTAADRIDALEVLTEITPGNVDDATIALHASQEASLSREAIARIVLDMPTNLYDDSQAMVGWTIPGGQADPVEHNLYNVSDFIPVLSGQTYSITGPDRFVWLDEDQNYVGHGGGLPTNTYYPDAPEDAHYVRLVIGNSNRSVTQINRGDTLLPYEPGGPTKVRDEYLPMLSRLEGGITPDQTSFFDVSTNLYDKYQAQYAYALDQDDGQLRPRLRQTVSDWIPVAPNQRLTFYWVSRVAFYDDNKAWLGSALGYVADQSHTITVPSGAAYMRATVSIAGGDIAQINRGDTLLPYEPGGVHLQPRMAPPKTYNGHTPRYMIDTNGLSDTYDAPSVDAQPGLDATTTSDIYGWYDDLMAAHPDYVTRRDLGVSSDGVHHLYAYTLKAPEMASQSDGTVTDETATPMPVALLISGVHGYEKAAVWNLWRLAQALCQEWDTSPVLDTLRWNTEIVIVPVSNPHSYDASTPGVVHRTNANGVDVARNFPAGWQQGTFGSNQYGGSHPLSEPENIALDALMREVRDRAVLGASMHNFSASPENRWMLWQAAPSQYMIHLGKQLIARMSRKWRKDHDWITDDRTYYGYSNLSAPPGSEGWHMEEHGIPGSTFETSRNQYLDGGDGDRHTSRAMTLGYEATVNYVAMGIKAGLEAKPLAP